MTTANLEVCLLASPVSGVIQELRALLGPANALPHEILECIDASYCDQSDALTLRLRFSEEVSDPHSRQQLIGYLRELGLEVVVPQALTPFERAKFENQLRDQFGFRVRRHPSLDTPCVLPGIIDSLEQHLAAARARHIRRLTTELDAQPSTVIREFMAGDAPHERQSTLDALDLVISDLAVPQDVASGSSDSLDIFVAPEPLRPPTGKGKVVARADLPLRMETFGALDDMIANLPKRARTRDALAELLDDL